MIEETPPYLDILWERRIAYPRRDPPDAWVFSLCCSEVIRWANNIACDVVHSLVGFLPMDRKLGFEGMADNFRNSRNIGADSLRRLNSSTIA